MTNGLQKGIYIYLLSVSCMLITMTKHYCTLVYTFKPARELGGGGIIPTIHASAHLLLLL